MRNFCQIFARLSIYRKFLLQIFLKLCKSLDGHNTVILSDFGEISKGQSGDIMLNTREYREKWQISARLSIYRKLFVQIRDLL